MRALCLLGAACLVSACDREPQPPEPRPQPPPAPAASSAPVAAVSASAASTAPQDWALRDVNAVAFDGRRVAIVNDRSFDGPFLSIYDGATGVALASKVAVPGDVRALLWGLRGERLAVVTRVKPKKGTETTELHIFELQARELRRALRAENLLAAFDPTSGGLVVGRWGDVEVRDREGTEVAHVLAGKGKVTAIAIRSDGLRLALARRRDGASSVELWDHRAGQRSESVDCGDTQVTALAWSADWSRLAWTESELERGEHRVAIRDRDGDVRRSSRASGGSAHALVFSGDGRWLMSVSNGPTIWRSADASRHLDLRPGKDVTWGGAFLPEPDRMALFVDDALRRVDLNSGRTVATTEIALGPKSAAHAFSPDGTWLVAGSFVKTVLVPLP